MKLYGFPMSPNSRRAQLALEELGIAYEYVTVDLMKGEQKAPAYLALNPNGRVPTLVDGEFILWDSHAIAEYLAAKHPDKKLDGTTPAERAEVAQWTYLNAAHFGPAFARVFAHTMRLPEDQRIPRVAEEGRAEATRVIGVLDQALRGRDGQPKEWLVASRITVADLAFGATLPFASMLGFDLSGYPSVASWLERLMARPSFKKVLG
jgi:glutathione S-transferase